MRAFTCRRCGQLLFENSLCLRCRRPQGLLPSTLELIVPDGEGDGYGQGDAGPRRCANASLARCSWLVEDDRADGLCRSCRLTGTRPADSAAAGLKGFAVAETAKRRRSPRTRA